ncbi:Uma2 family endonuclease [Thiolapillus sp.]
MGHPRDEDLPHYTYEDYVQWEGRWELIHGIPYAMTPTPSIQHQKICQHIAVGLDRALSECEACLALLPVDWKIDEDTVVQPDNLVICDEVTDTYLRKAPIMIFEVLSKSTASKDKNTKFALYE